MNTIFRIMNTVFRIESPAGLSLWYDDSGYEMNFAKTIGFQKAADMPMPFNEKMKSFGLNWYSAVNRIEDFVSVFGPGDLEKAYRLDYKLWIYETPQIIQTEWHPIFLKEGSNRIELPFQMAFDLNKKFLKLPN